METDMTMKTSLAALTACLTLGSSYALAQRSETPARQDNMGQQRMSSSLDQRQVRSFYDQMEQTIQQAFRNDNPRQATQFMRRHLSEDATFVNTNSLSINGKQVATTVVTLDDDTLSNLLGFAANAMQGGRRNIQNYRIEIDVRDVQPIKGENAVRVNTVMRESGQIRTSQENVSGMSGQRTNPQQSQFTDQQGRQRQSSEQMGDRDRQEQSSQTGNVARGLGADPTQFQVTAQCEQILRLDTNGQIKIGNTLCRSNTQVDS